MHNLFLIGPMGAGKTTLGRMIAAELNRPFFDSDRIIEERTGVDIPTIFDYEGEQGFRLRESRIINELTRLNDIVLATGGGVILRTENQQHLAQRGFVVYLKVSVKSQLERTSKDKSRPLLQIKDPETKLSELAVTRTPLYEATSDFSVDTDHHRTRTLKTDIINAYKKSLENSLR
jgi:shikimate kinase